MRSVPAGSFSRLSAVASLWRAWREYSRGKGRWPAVAQFALDADTAIFALHRDLRAGRYLSDRYSQHVIHDPKTRLISAPSLRDRVLHQAVVGEIGPVFVRGFIHDSYACRPGRGPQRAILRYLHWTRRYRWRMTIDVRRYFPSVQHETLIALLKRRIRDRDTRALVAELVRSGGEVYRTPLAARVMGLDTVPPPGTGLPIGSCFSQFAANLYLSAADHFIKRDLRIRGYLRYMDDATLFADDAALLDDARAAITEWLAAERGLAVNPRSGHIVPAAEPSVYLGYRVSRAGLSPGRKMRRRMRRNLRAAAERGEHALRCSLASYQALVRFG